MFNTTAYGKAVVKYISPSLADKSEGCFLKIWMFSRYDVLDMRKLLPDILQEQGQPGKFKLGNMTVTVRRLEESQNSLIQVS